MTDDITINPEVSFGRPCIAGTGIPAEIVHERYIAGESVAELMRDYGRTRKEIMAAIAYEINNSRKKEQMMLIIHHNDNDGRLGAAICARHGWMGGGMIKYLEMDYKDDFDPAMHVKPNDQVVIVDFSIKPEEMTALLEITSNVTWLDHHKTAIEMYADFPDEIKGIREEGSRAGCRLAWDYFTEGKALKVPLIVELISDYDTWTLSDSRSKALNYGLQAVDTSPHSSIWDQLLGSDHEVVKFVAGGEFVLGFAQRRGLELAKSYGYFADLDGVRIFCMHNPNPGMDWFWLLKDNGADAFARIAFDGKKYTVSLYSEKIDVSVICKEHGGGGHPGAGGFVCDVLPWKEK